MNYENIFILLVHPLKFHLVQKSCFMYFFPAFKYDSVDYEKMHFLFSALNLFEASVILTS